MASSTLQQPRPRRQGSESRRVVTRHRQAAELRLPPLFFLRFDEREGPPRLTVSDLPEPEKFHERLAAWLLKQH